MSILHICNTFFEWELAGLIPATLEEAFAQNPIFLQLQFLPLLYAQEMDGVVVTKRPSQEEFSSLYLLSDDLLPFTELDSWGYSKLIQKWAKEHGLSYEMPPWDVVKMVNSKTYSFSHSPLPGAKLLYEGDTIPEKYVLKSCFGTAGRGLVFSDRGHANSFCQKQWSLGLPVIAEPWVERLIDFSTQWKLSSDGEISFLGTTFCKTTENGTHESNTVGDWEQEMDFASFISEQKSVAQGVLKEMSEMGFFGEVGFDAMVYNGDFLQPIVEINARKTMGWAALKIQQKKAPNRKLELAYFSSDAPTPLPKSLEKVNFSKQVRITIH